MIHKYVNIGVVEKGVFTILLLLFWDAYIDTPSREMQVLEEYANSATDSYSGQGKAEPALIQTHTTDAIEADSWPKIEQKTWKFMKIALLGPSPSTPPLS